MYPFVQFDAWPETTLAIDDDLLKRIKEKAVDLPENAEVHVTIQTAVEARTPLGRRLRELRAEIVRSGMVPLGWDEIESEVAVRRGGWREGS